MTLEQKIGQLLIIGWQTDNADDIVDLIKNYHFGNVILFTRNIRSAEHLKEMTAKIQEAAIKYNGVPALIAIDQEGGNVRRVYNQVTKVPGHMAIGSASFSDEKAAYKIGSIIGEELKCLGVNFNMAPVSDVNSNPYNPVIGIRAFSDDPNRVAKLSKDYAKGLEKHNVLASYKHFMGHGNVIVDSHLDLPHLDTPLEELKKVELIPYLDKSYSPPAIMTAHILYSQLDDRFPATISKKIIHDFLRKELNYNGLVVTDCFEMDAITRAFSLGEAAIFSIKATVDLVTISHTFGRQLTARNALIDAVKKGIISEDELNERLNKVLKYKDKYAKVKTCNVDWKQNQDIANEISKRSVALISGKPFKIDNNTVVIGVTNYLSTIAEDANVEKIDVAKRIGEAFNIPYKSIDNKNFNVNEISSFAKDKKVVLALTDSHITLVQKVLYSQLVQRDQKLMLISMRTPYDVLQQQQPTCHFATFEYTTRSVKSLIRVLKGERAIGKCPVDLDKIRKTNEHSEINNQLVRKALEYIDEHYATQIRLIDVADELKVSREHLSRIIKEHTNENFIDYLIRTRINSAKNYLATSTLRVYEIAHVVGFTEPSYFTRKFKEINGITPKEYRDQYKGT